MASQAGGQTRLVLMSQSLRQRTIHPENRVHRKDIRTRQLTTRSPTGRTQPTRTGIVWHIDMSGGDGSTSGWTSLYEGDVVVEMEHSWSDGGTYQVRAQAKDSKGSLSGVVGSEKRICVR